MALLSKYCMNNPVIILWRKYSHGQCIIIETMNKVSKYNYMAIGMSEKSAIKRTKRSDKSLYNRIIRSLTNIGVHE
jgi:hypothetical protein